MRHRPSAYTLVETLLVLALLVLAAALVAPAVQQGGARADLEDAAEKLSVMWSRARLDAITSGQVQLFRCQPGGSEASVGGIEALLAAASGDSEAAAAVASAGPSQQLTLDGVTIQSISVAEPPGSEPLLYEASAAAGQCVVVFRPDGAASDAEATLQHEDGKQLRVTLRGLTGATRVVEVDNTDGGAR
ncbi:hypothetical protein KOR34_00380 [Posidoniimonas corsicana]|uniref:General secretion pathway GspH domain-containing protein n=1 Tax=Posidoniimonas corsicana TaxID=1938618 RepID=A0A5C5VA24_9BACT|nr:hypothetical protein [Posidoniimonas corsicana]TWT35151.1 hypothetical protein KOR34_00380 [Posidoniimonas corsicana]